MFDFCLILMVDMCVTNFYTVHKAMLASAQQRLVVGAAMFEGSLPVSILVPSLHYTIHYGKQTKRFGPLDPLAMWSFERLNFFFKNHFIRNNSRPMASAGLCLCVSIFCDRRGGVFALSHHVYYPVCVFAASSVTVHDAARYFAWKRDDHVDTNVNGVCR